MLQSFFKILPLAYRVSVLLCKLHVNRQICNYLKIKSLIRKKQSFESLPMDQSKHVSWNLFVLPKVDHKGFIHIYFQNQKNIYNKSNFLPRIWFFIKIFPISQHRLQWPQTKWGDMWKRFGVQGYCQLYHHNSVYSSSAIMLKIPSSCTQFWFWHVPRVWNWSAPNPVICVALILNGSVSPQPIPEYQHSKARLHLTAGITFPLIPWQPYILCVLHGLQPSIYPTFISKLKRYLVLHMFSVIVCPVNSFNNEAYGLSSHFKNLGCAHSQLPGITYTIGRSFSACNSEAEKMLRWVCSH